MEDIMNEEQANPEDNSELINTEGVQEVSTAEARMSELQTTISRKDEEILKLKSSVEELSGKVDDLSETLTATIQGYRTLVVATNPDILPDLIQGESMPAIDESVKKAREIVARVKKGMEAELITERFPSGTPERGNQVLDLSPREKIQQGISTADKR